MVRRLCSALVRPEAMVPRVTMAMPAPQAIPVRAAHAPRARPSFAILGPCATRRQAHVWISVKAIPAKTAAPARPPRTALPAPVRKAIAARPAKILPIHAPGVPVKTAALARPRDCSTTPARARPASPGRNAISPLIPAIPILATTTVSAWRAIPAIPTRLPSPAPARRDGKAQIARFQAVPAKLPIPRGPCTWPIRVWSLFRKDLSPSFRSAMRTGAPLS